MKVTQTLASYALMGAMTQVLRIAYARINQETNALSPVATTFEDFQKLHYFEREAIEENIRKKDEVPQYLKEAELSGFLKAIDEANQMPSSVKFEAVPLLSAWAVPSGPLSRDCFEQLRHRLKEMLQTYGPFDAVYLSLHGAMGAEGVRDPDSRLLEAVHEACGRRTPLAASFDLHANITKERIRALDILTVYQTNPHRDQKRTGYDCGHLLTRMLRKEIQPQLAWRSLPMLLGGGFTVDLLPPVRSIFRRIREVTKSGDVLSGALFMCHMWNNDPALGWSVVVMTDRSRERAESIADEIAERAWHARHQVPPDFTPIDQAIADARKARLARTLGVVAMCDASDVVAAGAPGENTKLLRALLQQATDMVSYVPIRDSSVARSLWDSLVGATVTVSIGGKLDPARNQPLTVSGTIRAKAQLEGFEKVILLDLVHVQLVITEGPALVMKPSFYTQIGLSLWKADIVVAKSFFPFLMYFLPYSRKYIYVHSGGVTDPKASFALQFDTPMYPRDVVEDWRPADQLRRGMIPSTSLARENE